MGNPRGVRPQRAALADLPSLKPQPTAAERAAEVIRDGIFEGRFMPGTPLPETDLADALGISRNTVREAFRTLQAEHLLDYEVNKGVSVRRLTPADAADIYRIREILELSSLELITSTPAELDTALLTAAVAEGRHAADNGDWVAVGTANLRFHAQIVALQGSPRLDEFFQRVMTEMRLGFLAVADPRSLHEPYLDLNGRICAAVCAGELAEAREMLRHYLHTARAEIVAAVTPA
ncbi:GntR family transcriptional regulator [Catellatospora methionotrophica]|uniref:GntR family transcriptional regulator n=1 Tax=Catellatospora methionotrophica TaxID=121620 RepID=UPI0033CB9091